VKCPVCGSRAFGPAITTNEIRAEIELRERFVLRQLGRRPSRSEAKDLTDFMHGFAAPLRACSGCRLLVRAERRVRDAGSYSEDPNDPDIMQQLLPRYVGAFRNKAPGFRDLLRDRADVLEIGSHLGAFLQVAEEWNWTAIGLDVGADMSSFARANGFRVRREMVEDTRLAARSFDAVFLWNCFEQLSCPASTLDAIYRLLRPGGLAVLRIPNARFYLEMRSRNGAALAWNNLLGFPYLYGYREEHVNQIANDHGFEFVRGFDSELITMPFPDLNEKARKRQCAGSRKVGQWSLRATCRAGALTGPWIEMAYRKLERPAPLREGALDGTFLARAA
jgi:SAM-dependent methyltransferase